MKICGMVWIEFNDIKVFKDIHQKIITSVDMYYKHSIDGEIL